MATATEWVLIPENVFDMWKVIGPSKPHQSYPAGSKQLQVDGLTIWAHGDIPRTWARFGDTIRREGDSWVVIGPDGVKR